MHRLTTISISSAVLACATAAPSKQIERYTYIDGMANSLVLARAPGAEEGRAVTGGHQFYGADFCGEDHEYHCFSTELFSFAVPRTLDPKITQWSHEGRDYGRSPDTVSMQILGTRIDGVYQIGAGRPEFRNGLVEFEYLYSPTRGLIAIKRYGEECQATWPTLWLVGKTGFGGAEPLPTPDADAPPVPAHIRRLPEDAGRE